MSQRLFTIGEIAKKHGLTLRTLRFWEDEGLIAPERRGTTRLYSEADDARIARIAEYRSAGFSIFDVIVILELEDTDDKVAADDLAKSVLLDLVEKVQVQSAALSAVGARLGIAA